jgi:hypothetical protein
MKSYYRRAAIKKLYFSLSTLMYLAASSSLFAFDPHDSGRDIIAEGNTLSLTGTLSYDSPGW